MKIINRIFLVLIFLLICKPGWSQAPATASNDSTYASILEQMGFDSPTLRIAGEFDSARAYQFMKTNDPRYGNRPEYKVALLGMLQHIKTKSEDNYYLYDSLLAVTPNYLLSGLSYHLYNKLYVAIPANTDSAYMIIKLLSRSSHEFRNWMQQTFCQTFTAQASDTISKEDIASWRNDGISERKIRQMVDARTRYVIHGNTLLSRMALDTDTSISDFARPLYLWDQARTNPANKAIQQQALDGFSAMSDAQSMRGNAQRYALQLYKQLLQNGQLTIADSLLDHTITHLQRETNDSTNPSHRGAKNLQAYAWELKYERVKDGNPKAAMALLGKAAALSPKNPTDKDYDSFYDRYMLQSKESYRSDYAEALIRSGDKKMAMYIMGDQLTSDPSFITEFKTMFEKEFPNGNFTGFFDNIVKQTWKQAPAFKLTGLDGKQHSLPDYRGKWLVMDFWGTWCPPCRQELPEVNKFAISVANSPDIAFLSVDCRDTETAVRNFIKETGYTMPVVLSDNKIEKDYTIQGYPSKVIVTPNGAMLLLEFGANWQAIVSQLSALSKAPQKPKPAVSGKTTVHNNQE